MKSNSDKYISEILIQTYRRAGLWHGTGRYAYRNGQVFDILKEILKVGGLVPHVDDWDQKRGASISISVAPARVYARLYAELYRHINERETLRAIRPRLVWSAYFFLRSKWVAWNEYSIFRPHIVDVRKKTVAWTLRLARKPRSFTGAFLLGASDIPGNYPILIGIRPGAVTPTHGSRFIDLHEQRASHPISLSNFTHIEVPRKHVNETLELFATFNTSLPVLPIEEGDAYCWYFTFRHLAHGLTLAPIFARKELSY